MRGVVRETFHEPLTGRNRKSSFAVLECVLEQTTERKYLYDYISQQKSVRDIWQKQRGPARSVRFLEDAQPFTY